MTKICKLFLEYSDPIGGVTTWGLNFYKALLSRVNAKIIGMCSELEREAYAETFLPESNVYDVISLAEIERLTRLFDLKDYSSILNEPKIYQMMAETNLYFPNYFELGFQLAALSRHVNIIDSYCIAFCHTDEDFYYNLLMKYQHTITKFIAVSVRCEQKLLNLLPHRKTDILQWTYGVNVPKQQRLKQTEKIKLLYIGRIQQKQKRIFDFIYLVELLEKCNIDFTLDFVGSGPDFDVLVHKLKIYHSKICFHGALSPSDVSILYPNYDCLVMTSETEGTSIALLEAMACGLVPIVTNVSGAEEVIHSRKNGFLFEIGDLEHACAIVNELSKNRNLLEQISVQARQTILDKFEINYKLNILVNECLGIFSSLSTF